MMFYLKPSQKKKKKIKVVSYTHVGSIQTRDKWIHTYNKNVLCTIVKGWVLTNDALKNLANSVRDKEKILVEKELECCYLRSVVLFESR